MKTVQDVDYVQISVQVKIMKKRVITVQKGVIVGDSKKGNYSDED